MLPEILFLGCEVSGENFSNATHEVILVMENLLSLPGLPTTLYWWSGGTSFWFLYG
jgi:hypothetical protein